MSDMSRHDAVSGRDAVVNLEFDETIPPRPEEEIADAARAEIVPGAGVTGAADGQRG